MSLCECEMCRAQNSYENGSTMNERFGRLERVVNKFACLSFFFFFSQYEYETREIRFNRIYESNLYDRFIYTNKE